MELTLFLSVDDLLKMARVEIEDHPIPAPSVTRFIKHVSDRDEVWRGAMLRWDNREPPMSSAVQQRIGWLLADAVIRRYNYGYSATPPYRALRRAVRGMDQFFSSQCDFNHDAEDALLDFESVITRAYALGIARVARETDEALRAGDE